MSRLSSHLSQLFSSLVLLPPSSFTQEMGQIFFVLTLINLSEYFVVVVIFLRNPGLCPQCSRNRTFLLLLSLQLVFLPFAQGNLFSSRLEVGAYEIAGSFNPPHPKLLGNNILQWFNRIVRNMGSKDRISGYIILVTLHTSFVTLWPQFHFLFFGNNLNIYYSA